MAESINLAYGSYERDPGKLEIVNTTAEDFAALNATWLPGESRLIRSSSDIRSIARPANISLGKADSLERTGDSNYSQGEYYKARSNYFEAFEANSSSSRRKARLLMKIGVVYRALGQSKEALDSFNQASLDMDDPLLLYNIGLAKLDLGDKSGALKSFDGVLTQVARNDSSNSEKLLEGLALKGIGSVFASSGDGRAIDYFNRALPLLRLSADVTDEAAALNSLGRFQNTRGAYSAAFANFNRARSLYRIAEHLRGEAETLNEIANLHFNQGHMFLAADKYKAALSLFQKTGDLLGENRCLKNLGRVSALAGDYDQAFTNYKRSLAISEALNDPRNVADINIELGRLARERGDQKTAGEYFDRALQVKRQFDDKVTEAIVLHEMALASRDSNELKRATEFVAKAIEIIESQRNTISDITLRLSSFSLMQKCYDLYIDLLVSLHTTQPGEGHLSRAFEISERGRARGLIDSRPWLTRNRGVEQAEVLLPSTREIQSQILDEDTLLLSYVLGDKRSFLFAVGNNSLNVYVLPERSVIEAEATRVYEALVNSRSAAAPTRGSLETGFSDAGSFKAASQSLAQMLLGPVRSELVQKRLLIVTDGALQEVPFAALPVTDSGKPLIVDHEIVSLPSASALALSRKEAANRQSPTRPIAIFADPVVTESDPRMKTPPRPTPDSDKEKYQLHPLPYAGWEARQIAALSKQSFVATGFASTREAVTSEELSKYQIVHFATHGILDVNNPEQSSLVLSLFDEEGKERDGFLRLGDIYKLKLPVDLVVLSGCQTGIGKALPGEGTESLTHGFLRAGASQVLFSLWAVDDRATADFMVRFYRKIVSRNLPATKALRETQIEMSQDERWNSPYYWAPFVLQGEFTKKLLHLGE